MLEHLMKTLTAEIYQIKINNELRDLHESQVFLPLKDSQ